MCRLWMSLFVLCQRTLSPVAIFDVLIQMLMCSGPEMLVIQVNSTAAKRHFVWAVMLWEWGGGDAGNRDVMPCLRDWKLLFGALSELSRLINNSQIDMFSGCLTLLLLAALTFTWITVYTVYLFFHSAI